MLEESGASWNATPRGLFHPTSTGIIMTLATLTKNSCTNIRHGELIITPGGVVSGLTRDGWWSLPVSHHAPQGACDSTMLIDRWLDDVCTHTSDTGWDRGHRWKVTIHHPTRLVPLPRRGQWRLLGFDELQQMSERTAALAAGTPDAGEPVLLPAWVWWLWTLDRVHLPVADALGVLEYVTAHEKSGFPWPRGETALRPI